MANATMMGWDADAGLWRKLVCNAAGKLIIDPSEILEDVPTDNEVGKAPTSNWAHDHATNASAHHARYTDAESRAAIGDLLDSTGKLLKDLDGNYLSIDYLRYCYFRYSAATTKYTRLKSVVDSAVVQLVGYLDATHNTPAYLDIYNGTAYERVAVEPVVDTKIATHADIAAAHHTRYTDAEAVAAVGYGGTKYWSCGGIHFNAVNPATDVVVRSTGGGITASADNITFIAQALLPQGAVITSVIVTGNAAASAETWSLRRETLSSGASTSMATAAINTADTTISDATIDNSLYAYIFSTSTLDTSDAIYGVTITYTI